MLALLLAVLGLGLVSPLDVSTTPTEVPKSLLPAFTVPESLHYTIKWIGIPVGESTLTVEGVERSELGVVYHFASTARSNHILRFLYPVKTRIDSFVETARFLPVRYTMRGRQGFNRRDRELRFDHVGHQVSLSMAGKERVYPTAKAVQDPLSALYYYRTVAAITPGEVVRIPVHDRKRPKEIVVTAGPVETVKTGAGTFEAIRLNVKQTEEGLFLHEGDITLWVTTDPRRLPVRMVGDVFIGTVEAELMEYRITPELVDAP